MWMNTGLLIFHNNQQITLGYDCYSKSAKWSYSVSLYKCNKYCMLWIWMCSPTSHLNISALFFIQKTVSFSDFICIRKGCAAMRHKCACRSTSYLSISCTNQAISSHAERLQEFSQMQVSGEDKCVMIETLMLWLQGVQWVCPYWHCHSPVEWSGHLLPLPVFTLFTDQFSIENIYTLEWKWLPNGCTIPVDSRETLQLL